MSLIEDVVKRNVTYCKRKKGLIKKAIEISKLCGKKVAIYILDDKIGKFIAYNSTGSFNISAINKCVNGPLSRNELYEKYNNADYNALCEA